MVYNLFALLEMANRYLDQAPDMKVYRDGLVADLNDAYLELCGAASYLFLQADATLQMVAPVVGSSSAVASVENGVYAVTLTGATVSESMEGGTFIGPDGVEYVIARTSSAGGTETLWLTEPYAGSTDAAADEWAIRMYAYKLPDDCEEVLSIVDGVTNLPIPFVSRALSEQAVFQPTSAGAAIAAVDTVPQTDRGPDNAPTVAAAAGGALIANTDYEICYTLAWCGRESPPSPIATVTTTGVNKTINVSAMEDTQEDGQTTGIYKVVYMRNATQNGRWLRASDTTGITEAVTTFTFNNDASVSRRMTNELMPTEPWQQYLRFHPPAVDDRIMRIRYQRKVRRLAADADVPLIPPPYTPLIVFRALVRRATFAGSTATASIWKNEATELEKRMKDHWLTRQNTIAQRQMINVQGVPNALGPGIFRGATYTYSG